MSKFKGCILRMPITSQWCAEGCPISKAPLIAIHKSVLLFIPFEKQVQYILFSPLYPKMHSGLTGWFTATFFRFSRLTKDPAHVDWILRRTQPLNLDTGVFVTPPHLDVNPRRVGRRRAVRPDAIEDLRQAAVWVALHEQDETSQRHKHTRRDGYGFEERSPRAPFFFCKHLERKWDKD